MNVPNLLVAPNPQAAYLAALAHLKQCQGWETFNLMVQVESPLDFDDRLHAEFENLAERLGLKTPRQVAHTIFPDGQLLSARDSAHFYSRYLSRFLPYYRKKMHGSAWGTYFGRLVGYDRGDSVVNQLGDIIDSINRDGCVRRAAYVMLVPYPGSETRRPLGAPCLNYLALQLEPGDPPSMGLLAVYRNHYFAERAYGNYLGLASLLEFTASQTGHAVGRLTCLSSHAKLERRAREVSALLTSEGL